jgi:periplasmic protein TonB
MRGIEPSAQPTFVGLTGAAITLILHLAAVAVLLQFEPARSALRNAAPIMVRLIEPIPVLEKPKEPTRRAAVRTQVERTHPAPQLPPAINAASEIPSPQVRTPEAPARDPEVDPAAPVAIAMPAPMTAPVIPPNFNAAYLNNPPPTYPAAARRSGQQGKVVLRVRIDIGGRPEKIELRASSGFDWLDQAALEAVKRWRFVPAMQGGEPVAAWVLVPIVFTLES